MIYMPISIICGNCGEVIKIITVRSLYSYHPPQLCPYCKVKLGIDEASYEIEVAKPQKG